MEGNLNFAELDNWLGTLEELKLGLNHVNFKSSTKHEASAAEASHLPPLPLSTNEMCSNESRSSFKYHLSPRNPSAHIHASSFEHPNFVAASNDSASGGTMNNILLSSTKSAVKECDLADKAIRYNEGRNGLTKLQIISATKRDVQESAEHGLNSLLKDLEAVEERIQKLEQGSSTFTRRYSLISSSNNHPNEVQQPKRKICQFIPTKVGGTSFEQIQNENGFISAQWVTDINRDIQKTSAVITTNVQSPNPKFDDVLTSPAAWLGAGDACMSLPNSPQPSTPSVTLLQQTEAGIWCLNHDAEQRKKQVQLIVSNLHECKTENMNIPTDNNLVRKSSEDSVCLQTSGDECANQTTNFPTNFCQKVSPSSGHLPGIFEPTPVRQMPTRVSPIGDVSKDIDDDSSLSGISSWNPGQSSAKRDIIRSNTVAVSTSATRLSSSLSPDGSLSDKSLPDAWDFEHTRQQMKSYTPGSQMKKLVVRIFRPDKTTKAIMIHDQMTAGDVASMLIEKNFLQPSTALAVVEKVPTLRVERIFEEHESVAECIHSWPSSSQNMLFFEEREDLYGFIKSPKALSEIEVDGFPEWQDYLYIRKPREKTWIRRFCVLRSSGLYTSKRIKLPLSSTDLKRIVSLGEQLHLYTTTGGWSRSHSPTPHGFVLKPYSAQDEASTNIFYFCAADENSFRQWICRIRRAKYGNQLNMNYRKAKNRIQTLQALRLQLTGSNQYNRGSSSASIQRKTSLDIRSFTSTSNVLTSASSSCSISLGSNVSPSVHKRF